MKDATKVTLPKHRALAIALALSALVLAGALFWEWTQGLQLQQQLATLRTIAATEVPAQKILPEFNLPDAQAGFPELLSRNLFSGNRRSAATAGKGGRVAMKKGQFVLVGVLITPQQRSALLRDVTTNKTESVALVGVVRGMTLGEVEPSRVVLRQGAESEDLILNVQAGPKPPSAPPQARGGAAAAPPAGSATPPATPIAPAVPVVPAVPPAPAASAPARAASGASPPVPAPVAAVRPPEGVPVAKPAAAPPQQPFAK
jgi:hypothetical protein